MLKSMSVPKRPLTVLNFVLVGEVRSGTAVVQSVINQVGDVVCHLDLFHGSDKVRRASHEQYFGAAKDPERLPEWFTPETNPNRYLANRVFDNPLHGEKVVGVHIPYSVVDHYELYDLIRHRTLEGDFCVVHVTRNPVACFVSKKQAERTGVWRMDGGQPLPRSCPPSVRLDLDELVPFVRNSEVMKLKIQKSSDDQIFVRYKDLTLHFDREMQRVFEFLDIPPRRIPRAGIRRLRNRAMKDRIINYDHLVKTGPSDIRQFLTAEDLY